MDAKSLLKDANEQIKEEYGFSLLDRFLEDEQAPKILRLLTMASMNWGDKDMLLWKAGKILQRRYGYQQVPSQCELECSAGLWALVQKNPELLD